MDCHLLRSFTLAMHVPPHDKTLENHITFPKESENTTLSTCKHCCLNREYAEYTIYYYQCIETSQRLRFKSKLSRTRQKKSGKQKYTDYVVLANWAIGGQNFGRPVVKIVANATGRVLILLPVCYVLIIPESTLAWSNRSIFELERTLKDRLFWLKDRFAVSPT